MALIFIKNEPGLPAASMVSRGSVIVMEVNGSSLGSGGPQSSAVRPRRSGGSKLNSEEGLLGQMHPCLEGPDCSLTISGPPCCTLGKAQVRFSGLGRICPVSFFATLETWPWKRLWVWLTSNSRHLPSGALKAGS